MNVILIVLAIFLYSGIGTFFVGLFDQWLEIDLDDGLFAGFSIAWPVFIAVAMFLVLSDDLFFIKSNPLARVGYSFGRKLRRRRWKE